MGLAVVVLIVFGVLAVISYGSMAYEEEQRKKRIEASDRRYKKLMEIKHGRSK